METQHYFDIFISRVNKGLTHKECIKDIPIMIFSKLDFHKKMKSYYKNAKEYRYLITFTISPKKFETITDSLEEEIEDFIESQSKRKALKITHFAYVRELHDNKRPHWHVSIKTSKCLKKDRFNYYIKKYGYIDFSKSKDTNEQESLDYLSKSGTVKELI